MPAETAPAMKKRWPSSASLEGVDKKSRSWSRGIGVHERVADRGSAGAGEGEVPGTPARRRTVSFAPLPPRAGEEGGAPSMTEGPARKGGCAKQKSKGFRVDYSLGDEVRRSSHMLLHPTPELAFRAADSLRKHDFAFVKRSDGSYTYAILAFRSLETPGRDRGSPDSLEECMTFVTGGNGATKVLRRDQWGDFVRLASNKGPGPRAERDREWAPPCVISFVPMDMNAGDDDFSLRIPLEGGEW